MLDIELLKKNKNIKNIEVGFNNVTKITFIDNIELFILYNDNNFFAFLNNENINWGYSFEPYKFSKYEIYNEIYRMSNSKLRNIQRKMY